VNYKIRIVDDRQFIIVENESSMMVIPFADENTDYQAYLAWVAEGNEAEEWIGE
jgi:hypothetical protein